MPRDNKEIWTRRTTAERIQERKGVILAEASITARTRALYFKGAGKLAGLLEQAKTELEVDEKISSWVQRQWERGRPLYKTSNALCGLQHFAPWLKNKLPLSWRSFHTWRRLEVPMRAPPLPIDFLYTIANFALSLNDLLFAGLLLLGFEGLLRTGELLKLRPLDVVVRDAQCLIRLEDTKTSRRKSATEVVHFDRPWAVEVVDALVGSLRQSPRNLLPIWPFTAQAFRQRFKTYLRHFSLGKCRFRPYSLRRGGATQLFIERKSYDSAIQKGRWSSVRAARVYIQDALSELPRLALPPATLQYLALWFPKSAFPEGQVQGPWKQRQKWLRFFKRAPALGAVSKSTVIWKPPAMGGCTLRKS